LTIYEDILLPDISNYRLHPDILDEKQHISLGSIITDGVDMNKKIDKCLFKLDLGLKILKGEETDS
jgi:hypothetical protein